MLKLEVSTSGFDEVYKALYDLDKILTTDAYKKYIAKKCMETLDILMKMQLQNDSLLEQSDIDKYASANRYEIGKDYVLIANDSNLSQDDLYWVSSKTKERYPNGISLAYLIEYGTGLLGLGQDDWEVNVPSPSKHKDGTWTYKRDGKLHINVRGNEPKLIYTLLMDAIKENIQKWTIEYINEEID